MATIYGEVTDAQLAGTGGGGTGAGVPLGPFVSSNTGTNPPSLLNGTTQYGYGCIGNGSIVAATIGIASGQAGTATIAIAKNGTNVVTAFTNVAFVTGARRYYTVTFPAGTYPYVNGDYLTFTVTASSVAFTLTGYIVGTTP